MMQTEEFLYQPLWPSTESSVGSSLDVIQDVGMYISNMETELGSFDYFPSPTMSLENSSNSSLSIPFDPTLYDDELHSLLDPVDDSPLEALCDWMDNDHHSSPSASSYHSDSMMVTREAYVPHQTNTQASPLGHIGVQLQHVYEMEVDNQFSILCLLKAYGESVEMGQTALAGEILRRLSEKANPLGAAVERLAYHLTQALEMNQNQVDYVYLRQESIKNYQTAFQAFYQIFPFGRFAHFTANSMILESIPEDAEIVHVIYFDVCQGIQWPTFIEALGRRNRNIMVKLTLLKHDEDDCSFVPLPTKKHLHEHAQSVGVSVIVRDMNMEGLVSEMKRSCGGREWLAFNCMVGVPHMGRLRSMKHVAEFLKIARYSIERNNNRGVVAFGDGSSTRECDGFGAYFEEQMGKVKALFESMELNLPLHLGEARMAMESMFLAPLASTFSSLQMWEETKESTRIVEKIGLEGLRVSKNNLVEAKEVAREGEGLFWVRSEGLNENQMVLGSIGTSLVRVSCWR